MASDHAPVDAGRMAARPPSLLLATTLTLIVALGASVFGAFFLAIAAGLVPFLGSANALGPAGVLGAVTIGYGVLAVVAAAGLWTHRAWAWPLATTIHLVAFVGVLIALETGGTGSHILAGLALTGGGLAALVPPSTREALWR